MDLLYTEREAPSIRCIVNYRVVKLGELSRFGMRLATHSLQSFCYPDLDN
jgi:hypothetical protein